MSSAKRKVTSEMSALPSAGFSITVRVSVPADSTAIGRIATAVGDVGGIVTALDVVDSDHLRVIADVTCDTADSGHADQVVAALEKLDGLEVRKVSDRTFLLHLGGKIEVHSKVALRNRDELSRAYTPGVARVCMAIHDNPEDARQFPDTPHPTLEGHMPLDVGLTELGNGRYTKPAIIVMQPRKFKIK